jgi:hypothetical protein
MPETPPTVARRGKALPALASELWQLVVDYLKQETVAPVKRLGRFVAMGLAGALLLSVGVVLLAVGGLRVLQTELGTPFEDSWSWVPYLIILVVCGLVAGLAARAIGSHKRRAARKGSIAGGRTPSRGAGGPSPGPK